MDNITYLVKDSLVMPPVSVHLCHYETSSQTRQIAKASLNGQLGTISLQKEIVAIKAQTAEGVKLVRYEGSRLDTILGRHRYLKSNNLPDTTFY